jgi:hypothetical protein
VTGLHKRALDFRCTAATRGTEARAGSLGRSALVEFRICMEQRHNLKSRRFLNFRFAIQVTSETLAHAGVEAVEGVSGQAFFNV